MFIGLLTDFYELFLLEIDSLLLVPLLAFDWNLTLVYAYLAFYVFYYLSICFFFNNISYSCYKTSIYPLVVFEPSFSKTIYFS
jgi:hypothetical protein